MSAGLPCSLLYRVVPICLCLAGLLTTAACSGGSPNSCERQRDCSAGTWCSPDSKVCIECFEDRHCTTPQAAGFCCRGSCIDEQNAAQYCGCGVNRNDHPGVVCATDQVCALSEQEGGVPRRVCQ
ncbi:MAG: hypothetical protein AAF310_00250 [Myxococcota bacterium]